MAIIKSYMFGAMFFLFCSYFRLPTAAGFGPIERKANGSEADAKELKYELYDLDFLKVNARLLNMV